MTATKTPANVNEGLVADLAAGLIRARMLAPLTPIEPPKMSVAEIEAMLHDVAGKRVAQDRR